LANIVGTCCLGGVEAAKLDGSRRGAQPIFGPGVTDVANHAFRGIQSYTSQLFHGTDYWRTVLDGASGIDIYGHNGISVADIDGDGLTIFIFANLQGFPIVFSAIAGTARSKTLPRCRGLES